MPGIHPGFIQEGPQLTNTFESDDLLRHFLRWRMPAEIWAAVEPDLKEFGERCAGELMALADQAEAQQPKHIPFNPWGKRIDRIETSAAWTELHKVAARDGLVAIGYERKSGEYSRMHQFAKLYLFHPSSAFYTCPLAMTDGAARVIELHGAPELKERVFKQLTSRDPQKFWTSGQWMTERTGGSDVSGTSTVAKAQSAGGYQLFGDKWFTSATTSEIAMALAKVEGATDAREGMSLFCIELRDKDGCLQNIRINRLKDKLGTKALPTAELTLEGAPAAMVGGVGEGVKKVASLLNITRLYNSVTAVGTIARAVQLSKDYARKRSVFGRKLSEQPLHLETLAEMRAEFEGVFVLCFHLAHLLGREETGKATPDESALLRLLTPIVKLWSAKQSIAIVSEAIESFGGAGYIEDTGLPRLLRDSQVFSIWEGTTNVLSLDALRAIEKDQALVPFFKDVTTRLKGIKNEALKIEVALGLHALEGLRKHVEAAAHSSPEVQQAGARAFALGLARVYAGALLLEFSDACSTNGERPYGVEIARRFFRKPLLALPALTELDAKRLATIVYGS